MPGCEVIEVLCVGLSLVLVFPSDLVPTRRWFCITRKAALSLSCAWLSWPMNLEPTHEGWHQLVELTVFFFLVRFFWSYVTNFLMMKIGLNGGVGDKWNMTMNVSFTFQLLSRIFLSSYVSFLLMYLTKL